MLTTEIALEPKSFVAARADGPLLWLFVSAEHPVNVYIVDEANYEKFTRRQPFDHYGPGTVRMFSSRLQVKGKVVVIIENAGDASARVDYSLAG